MPEGRFRGHQSRLGGGVSPQAFQATARASGWLRASRESDRVALASGMHLPQQVPIPSSRVRSRRLVAPQFTAARICLSETALQTQMIMGAIVNANANDCQYRPWRPMI